MLQRKYLKLFSPMLLGMLLRTYCRGAFFNVKISKHTYKCRSGLPVELAAVHPPPLEHLPAVELGLRGEAGEGLVAVVVVFHLKEGYLHLVHDLATCLQQNRPVQGSHSSATKMELTLVLFYVFVQFDILFCFNFAAHVACVIVPHNCPLISGHNSKVKQTTALAFYCTHSTVHQYTTKERASRDGEYQEVTSRMVSKLIPGLLVMENSKFSFFPNFFPRHMLTSFTAI